MNSIKEEVENFYSKLKISNEHCKNCKFFHYNECSALPPSLDNGWVYIPNRVKGGEKACNLFISKYEEMYKFYKK